MSEELTTTQSAPLKRLVLMIGFPLLVAIVSGVLYLKGGRFVETDNAYVKADLVQISPEVSGSVQQVFASENQPVHKGDLLFTIDKTPYLVAIEKAQAGIAQVQTHLATLQASYNEKLAELAVAKSNLAFSQREQKRQTDLINRKYISTSQFDTSKQNTEIAALQVETVEKQLKSIVASLGGSFDRSIEMHPDYLTALAALHQAELDLKRTEVHAPVDGIISAPPKLGQYLAEGKATMTMVVNTSYWIDANFTEKELTHIAVGQPVKILIDTYPDSVWTGEVSSLSPATSSEFSVIPAQNATGNWVKIAQRLPVKISIDTAPDLPTLRAGLSAITEIDTGHQRSVLGFKL